MSLSKIQVKHDHRFWIRFSSHCLGTSRQTSGVHKQLTYVFRCCTEICGQSWINSLSKLVTTYFVCASALSHSSIGSHILRAVTAETSPVYIWSTCYIKAFGVTAIRLWNEPTWYSLKTVIVAIKSMLFTHVLQHLRVINIDHFKMPNV